MDDCCGPSHSSPDTTRASRFSALSSSTFERTWSTDTSDMRREVRRLLTFEERPELLRGSSLYEVMHLGGEILSSSNGNLETYERSKEVDHLDCFFSHNWSCPRIHKFLCLMLHFNLHWAFLGTFIWTFILLVISILGWAPTLPLSAADETMGVLGHLTPLPVFCILFCGMHEFMPYSRKVRVFLDKTCIHQEDEMMQSVGIEKLGAFLSKSDSVVVCYTPRYLNKLWTIYEAATFLCLKSVRNLHVIPFQLPWFFLAMTAVWMAFSTFALLVRVTIVPFSDTIEVVLIPIFGFGFAATCRRMARAKADINTTLANFSVDQCNCFDESDRPEVYRNIAMLTHARFNMPQETTQEEALSLFEEKVRTVMPVAFIKNLGRSNMSYKHVVMVCSLCFWSRFIDHLSCVVNDGYSFRFFLHTWGLLFLNFGLWLAPIALWTIDYCASRALHWTGWWDLAWTLFSCFSGYFVLLICWAPAYVCIFAVLPHKLGEPWSEEADLGYLGMIVYTILGCTLGPFFLSGARRPLLRYLRRRSPVASCQKVDGLSAIESAVGPITRDLDTEGRTLSQVLHGGDAMMKFPSVQVELPPPVEEAPDDVLGCDYDGNVLVRTATV